LLLGADLVVDRSGRNMRHGATLDKAGASREAALSKRLMSTFNARDCRNDR
jgi:hypothetical protein